jgi:tetratricopeptide (TPR) repeat protein
MNQSLEFVRGLVILGLAAISVILFIYWTCKKSEDPARMLFKWVLTSGVLTFMFLVVGPIVGGEGYGAAFVGVPLTAVCGLVLAIIWRHSLAGMIAKPFGSLYDGGSTPPEPMPVYSTARARQKQGKYAEAVMEIRKQLSRFPTDVEGQFLLAQILAEDLKDLPAAHLAIEHFCSQPGHAPKNLAFALYSMADWYLSVGHHKEAARQCLDRLIELLPNSEHALGAAQRIAHLAAPDFELEPRKFVVKEGPPGVGLAPRSPPSTAEPEDGHRRAAEFVEHLRQHPLDCEVREQLAVIYADHFGRLDLATDQLMQMIEQANQPARNVARWLNLLADIQIRCGADLETVQATLQCIIDRDPQLAAAELARNRIALLKLELKGKEKSQAVKLGSYQQNIGLKRSSPNQM